MVNLETNLKELFDTNEMTPEQLEKIQKVDEAYKKSLESYVKDEIGLGEIKKKLDETIRSVSDIEKIDSKKLVDQDTFKKKMEEITESIFKIKAATEKTSTVAVQFKSLEKQLEENLKEFIYEEKGIKKLNIVEMKKKGGVAIDVFVKADPLVTMTTGGAPVAGGITIDNQLSVQPRRQYNLRDVANVASISTPTVVYAELKDVTGDAAWVPEGGLKPSMKASLGTKTITAGKIALTAKVTTEVMTDIPQLVSEIQTEIVNKIEQKEEDGILNGNGQGGSITGVANDFPAFSLTGIEVSIAPNMYDAIVAAYTQIVSTSNMAYSPNAIRMTPVDYANMQLTKNANGDYIRPFKVGDELITGLKVIQDSNTPLDHFTMGDFRYLNIRDYLPLTLKFGWENDDFTHNRVTIVGEKRLLAYVKSQYKTAFVTDSFKNIKTAITKTTA